MSITIHINATTLRDLLAPVLPFADKGDTLPVLEAVHVRGHDKWLTAVATDRYRLGFKRVAADAPAGLDVLIPSSSVRAILATFKPTRSLNPELTLTFDTNTNRVAVESGALGDSLFDARMSFGLLGAEYPKISTVFLDSADAEPCPFPDGHGLNPHFLADLHKVSGDSTPMRLRMSARKDGSPGALLISIGDDFRAAIMPARMTDSAGAEPIFDESWRALLVPVPKAEPKAEAVAS